MNVMFNPYRVISVNEMIETRSITVTPVRLLGCEKILESRHDQSNIPRKIWHVADCVAYLGATVLLYRKWYSSQIPHRGTWEAPMTYSSWNCRL